MILAVDTESTTFTRGNPFDQRNVNVCISYFGEGQSGVVFAEDRRQFEPLYKGADLIVGFNLKYDLHWLRKLYDYVPERVWDCQLCEFFLGRQSPAYPDLDSVAQKYTGKPKDHTIEKYWEQGINTDQIPKDVVASRAILDAELTYNVYLAQRKLIKPHQQRLLSLQFQDLIVLQEMEWNGLHIDEELAEQKAQELDRKIQELQTKLNLYHSVPGFNWASNDHLSALLYGGSILQKIRTPDGLFKTGARKGQPKFRWVEQEFHLPRLYKPLRNTELQKEGKWSVEEPILKKLTGSSNLIDGILEIKGMEKQISTYLRGFPLKRQNSCWPTGLIHTTLNQCVAGTGRLTSTKPNCQNLPLEEVGDVFPSRFI